MILTEGPCGKVGGNRAGEWQRSRSRPNPAWRVDDLLECI